MLEHIHIKRRRNRLNRARKLPWFKQSIRNLRNIHSQTTNFLSNMQNRVQRMQPISQLSQLSPQNIVLRLSTNKHLCCPINLLHYRIVIILQLVDFTKQLIQSLLLLRTRPASRFSVRYHPFSFPFIKVCIP
ncbi:hypothetical protein Hanom_Chr04g00351551 [Helianthus anomalus]